ncbi:MAG: NADH-quinone oxidoreductase subunit N [Planctomycetota bacterium]
MIDKIALIWPEIILFATTCVVMVIGLSPSAGVRRQTALATGIGLVVALGFAAFSPMGEGAMPGMMGYIKALICVVGLMLLMLASGTVDRGYEASLASGKGHRFDPLRSSRGEFYAFFLFSLTGAMLCASANDLIWLFLALELTSLPTYVMVTMSTRGTRSQEAGVKYFFLGALGAAIFLYGFALLYGGTGSTVLFGSDGAPGIAEILGAQVASGAGINPIAMTGLILAIIGVAFKIAAVPMHFYTADVYEGAASSVSAFLAFVPKLAGIVTIILLVSLVGWGFGADPVTGDGGGLPPELRTMLWVMAALTMTVGNTLAVLQKSAKRMLAYSSIAHSGYMLVGIIAGPGGNTVENPLVSNGLAAVLFYLAVYGVTNVGVFGVLASLEAPGPDGQRREIESVDDLRGLCRSHPLLGWSMVVCGLSLLGLPPLLGFFGKLPLFTSAISAGEITLVVVLGLNSAIAAFYYLRLIGAPMLEERPEWIETPRRTPLPMRAVATVLSAGGVVTLAVFGNQLLAASESAGTYQAIDRSMFTGQNAEAPAIESPTPAIGRGGLESGAVKGVVEPVAAMPAG